MEPLIYVSNREESHNGATELESARMKSMSACIVVGVLLGMNVQAVTIGAFAIMSKYWGNATFRSQSYTEMLPVGVLTVLSQLDIILYVCLWMIFMFLLTERGYNYFRKKFDIAGSRGDLQKRRFLFVSFICFLGGVIVGTLSEWALVDLMLGRPVPLASIAFTMVLDLLLCLLMVWYYDFLRIQCLSSDDVNDMECEHFI